MHECVHKKVLDRQDKLSERERERERKREREKGEIHFYLYFGLHDVEQNDTRQNGTQTKIVKYIYFILLE
jgi:hypothetical protein